MDVLLVQSDFRTMLPSEITWIQRFVANRGYSQMMLQYSFYRWTCSAKRLKFIIIEKPITVCYPLSGLHITACCSFGQVLVIWSQDINFLLGGEKQPHSEVCYRTCNLSLGGILSSAWRYVTSLLFQRPGRIITSSLSNIQNATCGVNLVSWGCAPFVSNCLVTLFIYPFLYISV